MEKMMWAKPEMNEVAFAANEYVAACWSVSCNVPYGTGYFETNGIDGYQKEGDWLENENGDWYQVTQGDDFIASGSGCGKKHEVTGVESEGPKANAWWEESRTGKFYEVFYFQAKGNGWGSQNHHFSKVSDAVWDPNPNASN